MSESNERKHLTKLQSASIVSSGSGDVFVGGSFVPTPTIPANCSNLPNRHPNFVGRRNEIKKIMDALSSRAWIVTIDGIGGIGKTTLALEVAHLCKARYSDYPRVPDFTGYIWTSARGNPSFCLNDVIREILYVSGPFENRARQFDPEEQLSLAIRGLATEPRLLIIDNFETVRDESLHRFLRDLPEPSKVLITSRHHIQTGERVITMDGFEESEAVQLLNLEAERLNIPIGDHDATRLRIIAQKSYGIPLVIRWVMEGVYNGKSLEWVLESLEHATADDIFDYIFKYSLSIVDSETRSIFRSMSLLLTCTRLETIAAMNPEIAAIEERIGLLVSFSLVEDNRSLVQDNRRYQLNPVARYLAIKELTETEDKGKSCHGYILNHYSKSLECLEPYGKPAKEYLETEFSNIDNVIRISSTLGDSSLLAQCIQLSERVRQLDCGKASALFEYLVDSIHNVGDKNLALKLLKSIGNPYVVNSPVRPPMFFGREELLKSVQVAFESDKLRTPVISLIGPRRIGKTSILHTLLKEPAQRCVYVLLDLQALSGRITEFLFALARLTHRRLRERFNIAEPMIEEFKNQPFQAFDSYIESVLKRLGDMRLVMVFDEFDMLLHQRGEVGERNVTDLLNYLRSMVQRGAFGIITAGVTPLHKFPLPLAASPFFNIAVSRHVSFLKREAAIELIQKPTYGLLEYDSQAITYILDHSGCHPTLLQQLCFSIVDFCHEMSSLTVSLETVENAVYQVLERGNFFMDYLFRSSDDMGRIVMLTSASLADTNQNKFNIDKLIERLKKNKVKLRVSQLSEILSNLVECEILAVDNQQNYKFTVGIFLRWLVGNL